MDILQALYEIREFAEDGRPEFDEGICISLARRLWWVPLCDVLAFVSGNCKDWEYYSGDSEYPIGGAKEYYDVCGSGPSATLWRGDSLRARISLIDHLIEKLESGDVKGVLAND